MHRRRANNRAAAAAPPPQLATNLATRCIAQLTLWQLTLWFLVVPMLLVVLELLVGATSQLFGDGGTAPQGRWLRAEVLGQLPRTSCHTLSCHGLRQLSVWQLSVWQLVLGGSWYCLLRPRRRRNDLTDTLYGAILSAMSWTLLSTMLVFSFLDPVELQEWMLHASSAGLQVDEQLFSHAGSVVSRHGRGRVLLTEFRVQMIFTICWFFYLRLNGLAFNAALLQAPLHAWAGTALAMGAGLVGPWTAGLVDEQWFSHAGSVVSRQWRRWVLFTAFGFGPMWFCHIHRDDGSRGFRVFFFILAVASTAVAWMLMAHWAVDLVGGWVLFTVDGFGRMWFYHMRRDEVTALELLLVTASTAFAGGLMGPWPPAGLVDEQWFSHAGSVVSRQWVGWVLHTALIGLGVDRFWALIALGVDRFWARTALP